MVPYFRKLPYNKFLKEQGFQGPGRVYVGFSLGYRSWTASSTVQRQILSPETRRPLTLHPKLVYPKNLTLSKPKSLKGYLQLVKAKGVVAVETQPM